MVIFVDVAISDEISATFAAIIAGMAHDTENSLELKQETNKMQRLYKFHNAQYFKLIQFVYFRNRLSYK